MIRKIQPGSLKGTVNAVASKSQAHRALFLAAFSDAPTMISCSGISEDIEASLRAVEMLGAKTEHSGDVITICPVADESSKETLRKLDCGESGTTLRFVLPMIGVEGITAEIRLRGRLRERPVGELIRTLTAHGMAFDQTGMSIEALGQLRAGQYVLPGGVSSQYISSLLMALPLLEQESAITVEGSLSSAGYVDLTLGMMERFGVTVQRADGRFLVEPTGRYKSPGEITVEGDWSSASFWLAANALGSDIHTAGLDPDSAQSDRAAEALLGRVRAGGAEIDIDPTPDLLPVLAAVAAVTEGETRFVNAARLRDKESDRLETTAAMIRALGGTCGTAADSLTVEGRTDGHLSGGRVDAAGDHRIAMSAAVAATVCLDEVVIDGAETCAKSYPRFWEDYAALGGQVSEACEEPEGSRALSRDF